MKIYFFCSLLSLIACYQTVVAEEVSIVDCGAKADGEVVCTEAIQSAIDRVADSGGGKVIVPDGVFKTGSLFMKQGVELHLTKGAVLLGSTELADYPKKNTRIEGHFEPWTSALINATDLDGVKVTGSGVLDGNGKPFWVSFWKRRAENPKCTNLEVERPRLMFLQNCSNVEISGVHLKDSGFWNLHIYNCRDVLVEGIRITAPHGDPPKIVNVEQPWDELSVDRAPSSDGIDIDSCQRVTIRGCDISNGDDCIALKGTKGPLAMQDESSPPVEDITIENCSFANGHGMVTCGSEATIVRNVTVRNCRVGANVPLVRLKLRPDTPQLYENMLFENIEVVNAQALFDVKPWTQFFDLQGHEPPVSRVKNITLRNITGSLYSLGELRGNKGDQLTGITLESLDLDAQRAKLDLGTVEGFTLQNVRVNGQPFEVD